VVVRDDKRKPCPNIACRGGEGATPFQTDILVSYGELTAAICKTPLKNVFLCVFLRFFALTLPNLWRYWDVQ
jgi:hypothetical protein